MIEFLHFQTLFHHCTDHCFIKESCSTESQVNLAYVVIPFGAIKVNRNTSLLSIFLLVGTIPICNAAIMYTNTFLLCSRIDSEEFFLALKYICALTHVHSCALNCSESPVLCSQPFKVLTATVSLSAPTLSGVHSCALYTIPNSPEGRRIHCHPTRDQTCNMPPSSYATDHHTRYQTYHLQSGSSIECVSWE